MTPFLVNATLDFTNMELIGKGGEAQVYKSFDPQLNRIIAHKTIPLTNFSKVDEYFAEARKVFHAKHHHVVEIYYGCKSADSICLAMPYFDNGSLKGLIDARNLKLPEIIRFALQFLSGLNNIHAKGVLHFDFKPENVLITDANVAVVSDFGLAEYIRRSGTSRVSGVTPVMMPPEYLVQSDHTVRFDIYQAGLTLYRMCNTEARFQEQVKRVTTGVADPGRAIKDAIKAGKLPDRDAFLPHIPLALRRIIKKALQPNPADRYSTVFEMLNDLCRIENAHSWEFVDGIGKETWTRDSDSVTAVQNGNSWDIIATRNGKKKSAYSETSLDPKQKNVALTKCFKEWEREK